MIASGKTLRARKPVSPFCERTRHKGMTYGVGPAGYDVRIDQDVTLPPNGFSLASTMEEFDMPNDLLGIVHDKSTWARLGLAAQNTVIEPGWKGFLTLELTNHSRQEIRLEKGMPIAQIIFHVVDEPVEQAYDGKYQNQARGPQEAIFEKAHHASAVSPDDGGWVKQISFGEALTALKSGAKVAREGWNGKGMFLFLVPGSRFKVSRPPLLGIYPEGTEIDYHPHIDMKTAQGYVVPWLASQADMLAEDWYVV